MTLSRSGTRLDVRSFGADALSSCIFLSPEKMFLSVFSFIRPFHLVPAWLSVFIRTDPNAKELSQAPVMPDTPTLPFIYTTAPRRSSELPATAPRRSSELPATALRCSSKLPATAPRCSSKLPATAPRCNSGPPATAPRCSSEPPL